MANLSRLPTPVIEQWEWQYDGLCRTIDPEVFFPPDSERGPVRQRRESQAKQYCEQCPVLAKCREHALMVQEPYGVWGGLTPRERDRILHPPDVTGVATGPTLVAAATAPTAVMTQAPVLVG